MPAPFRPSFWEELRRRRVVRAVSVYAVVAWVAVQVADTFFPALRLPEWTVTVVAVLAVVGFPVTVAVAWIYERTAAGLRRTESADDGAQPASSSLGRQFLSALGLGALLGMVVVGTVFWLAGGAPWGSEPGDEGAVVAVLPFETVGEANPTFTEGIHGDVLTRLSGVPGLDVISRGSVMRYRDLAAPVSEVASELGVGWIVRGEVQQVGSRVQVNARLVDARRDRQVWAEAFQRELTAANLFGIQREITQQIVAALETRFAGGEQEGPRRGLTDDLEAYEAYAQGRGLLGSREEQPMRRAVEYFQRAIAQDSQFAAAWAGLADALTYLETFGYAIPTGTVAATRAARRALELEPGLAEAHFALANLAHANRDDDEAIRRVERAIALQPSYSDAYNLLSWMLKLHGRPGASLEAAERAVELHPLGSAPLSNLALAHLALGAPGAALEEARKIRDLHPGFTTGAFLEALALYHQGRYRQAVPPLQGLEVAWTRDGPAATLALAQVALGDTAAARRTAAGLDPGAHPFSVALVRAALGETESALDAMMGLERWDYWSTFAVRYFFPDVLRPLREDPRYAAVLQRVDASWR